MNAEALAIEKMRAAQAEYLANKKNEAIRDVSAFGSAAAASNLAMAAMSFAEKKRPRRLSSSLFTRLRSKSLISSPTIGREISGYDERVAANCEQSVVDR